MFRNELRRDLHRVRDARCVVVELEVQRPAVDAAGLVDVLFEYAQRAAVRLADERVRAGRIDNHVDGKRLRLRGRRRHDE